MRKTTIYLDIEDDAKLEEIKKSNGLTSDAPAIRLAIRNYPKKHGPRAK